MKSIRALCALTALVLGGQQALAEEAQMYFAAKAAPLGSISNEGMAEVGVYLRWDGLNSSLPADIAQFRIDRDGSELVTLDAAAILSAAEIEALYAGATQGRRKAETIRWLNEQAMTDLTDGFDYVDAGNFGAAIEARLHSDDFWGVFASRIDFNVARARHRGYLDTPPASGPYDYELFAISPGGQSVRVGQASVDLSVINSFPPARDFAQIDDYARCDAPEAYKEHGAVMLTWAPGSNGPADRFVESLTGSGYDLYRTTDNVETVTPLDLRALAASVSHDANGNVVIPGLEQVNDQPILYSGEADEETTNEGWNSPYAQYMQSAPEAAAEGLLPGDSRAYYIVARDFTGNYGVTAGTLVTIPDLAPPPAPWSIRVERNEATNAFKLVWDHINVANYYDDYQYARTYCNLDTARLDGQLRYVREGESCDTGAQIGVELDVASYAVFRFDNEREAAEFTDRDADGFADAIERIPNPDNPDLSSPGTACEAAASKGGAWIGDVPASSLVVRPSGRNVIEFADDVPAIDRGSVYWYRIAAIGANGNVSGLSAPVRGFFPARDRPDRPGFDEPGNEVTYGVESCDYQAHTLPFQDGLFEVLPFAWDMTLGDAAFVRLSCQTPAQETLEVWLDMSPENTEIPGFGWVPSVSINKNICRTFDACAGDSRQVEYYSGAGHLLAATTVQFPSNVESCPRLTDRSYLSKNCQDGVVTAWEPGEVTEGPLVVDYPGLDAGECLNVYRDVGGEEIRLDTICDPAELPLSVDMVGMAGGSVCLSVAVQNASNEVSSRQRLPCAVIDATLPPSPPQPLEIGFDTGADTGSLSFLPPEDPVSGTIVEWYWKGATSGGQTRFTQFVPHAGEGAQHGPQDSDIELTAWQSGADWQEEWCFRGRSVGSASNDEGGFGALSAWSVERCALREPVAGPDPEYLPWPPIPAVPSFGNAPARYLGGDFTPIVQVSDPITLPAQCGSEPPQCPREDGTACLNLVQEVPALTVGDCDEFCAIVESAVADDLGFVVYRQRTPDLSDPAQYGDFVQNSPLIDRIHCVSEYFGLGDDVIGEGALADPFLFMADFDNSDPQWVGNHIFYVDRQPFAIGDWYRYQLVYLNGDGEIIGQKHTDWIEAAQ